MAKREEAVHRGVSIVSIFVGCAWREARHRRVGRCRVDQERIGVVQGVGREVWSGAVEGAEGPVQHRRTPLVGAEV